MSEVLPLTNIFQNSIENLLLAEKQIQEKSNSHHVAVDFDLDTFWKDISVISQKISFECTKICISFSSSPLPLPNETSGLLTALEQAILALVSKFYKLSPVHGCVLQNHVLNCVVYAIQGSRQLLKIIKDEGGEGIDQRYRHSTGIVWQGCEKLEKCPKDNKSVVLQELRIQSEMVADALNEISEALEGDGSGWDQIDDVGEEEMETEKWSKEDKEIMASSVNLIKAAKILYKRLLYALEQHGSCDSHNKIIELDQIYEDCCSLSKTIDNLILELYPPLDVANMEEQSYHLASLLQTALKMMTRSHFTTEVEQPQIEFVFKAIEHNLGKMKEMLRKQ